jgi:hypothetical protein
MGPDPRVGYAEVIASTNDDVAAGTMHLYGYLPTSTHLVVTHRPRRPRGFVDTRRTARPSRCVQRYRRVDTDASEDPAYEDHRMVLWPLFFTSFLIGFLDDNAFFGAQASSRRVVAARTRASAGWP